MTAKNTRTTALVLGLVGTFALSGCVAGTQAPKIEQSSAPTPSASRLAARNSTCAPGVWVAVGGEDATPASGCAAAAASASVYTLDVGQSLVVSYGQPGSTAPFSSPLAVSDRTLAQVRGSTVRALHPGTVEVESSAHPLACATSPIPILHRPRIESIAFRGLRSAI